MRWDMSKVIVERPRLGVYGKQKGRNKEKTRSFIKAAVNNYMKPPKELGCKDLFYCCGEHTGDVDSLCWMETMPFSEVEVPSNKESMRPKGRVADRKELNENLEPLWRYLLSQVGRQWDDVYSDIRRNLSPRSTVQMHVVQHLDWQVKKSTYLGEDGRVYEHSKYNRGGMPDPCLEEPTTYKYGFYIHPVTRELCVSPTKAKKVKKLQPKKFQVSSLVQYRLINGEWMVVEFEKIPRTEGKKGGYPYLGKVYMGGIFPEYLDYKTVGDILYPKGLENYAREAEYGFINIRAVRKRSLGKREIKKLQTLLASS